MAVVTLALVAGCGGGKSAKVSNGVSNATVIAAAKKSIAANYVAFDMLVADQATSDGTASFATQRPKMQMKMVASGQTSKMFLIDDAYLVALTNDPGKYAKIDASRVGPIVFQPVTMVQLLANLPADKTGATKVDSNHWRITTPCASMNMDMGSASSGMNMPMGSASSGMHSGMNMTASSSAASSPLPGRSQNSDMSTDVWVDADGRINKIAMTMDNYTVTITYRQWGKPISISPPPAGDILPVSSGMIDEQMKAMGMLSGMGGDWMLPGG